MVLKVREEDFLGYVRPLWELGKPKTAIARVTAAHFGLTERSVEMRIGRYASDGLLERVKPDDTPAKVLPTATLIEIKKQKAEQRKAHFSAKSWRRILIPESLPVCIALMGDPHIDSPDCDWTLLDDHLALMRRAGVYAINVGDTLDNWPEGGRLARLLKHSDTSQAEAHQLARWLMIESGVRWAMWLLGNHDTFRDSLALLCHEWGGDSVVVEDWGARFALAVGERDYRVWACHDFPGSSQWNPLHGHRRAMDKHPADLYVAGHRHNWSIYHGEHEHQGWRYWFARARGYKSIHDAHAERLGYGSQGGGHTLGWVIDPAKPGPGYIYPDLAEAVDVTHWMRRRK